MHRYIPEPHQACMASSQTTGMSGPRGESRYCVQDKEVMSLGTANENGMMSPKSLLTPTLGDAIRVSNLYKGKSIGISIKDRGAILPAGHSANAAYWLDYESG